MTTLPLPAHVEQIAEFNRLRDEEPVRRVTMPSGDRMWLVSRYTDVKNVYSDKRFSRDLTAPGCPRMSAGGNWSDTPLSMVNMDGERHLTRRRPVVAHLTPKRIEALRAPTAVIVERLLDEMGNPAEFVEEFARPMPALSAALAVGVPEEDYDYFRHMSHLLLAPDQLSADEFMNAQENFAGYVMKLADLKRREPGEDMATAIVRAADAGTFPAEMVAMAVSEVMFGGMLNTRSVLCSGLLDLLREPETFRAIADDNRLRRDFTELVLAKHGHPVLGLPRLALEDVEIGDVLIRAGEAVVPVVTAANHDPERGDAPHIAFGFGPHHCIGAALVRMQLQVAFGVIARRLPALRVTVPEEDLVWDRTLLHNAVQQLPVTW